MQVKALLISPKLKVKLLKQDQKANFGDKKHWKQKDKKI